MEQIEKVRHAGQDSPVPLGIIAPASEYRGADARLRGPVLEQMVEFDTSQYANARRSAFDTFVMVGPLVPMIVFSLRLEDALLNWLADPTEPDVWKAIDTWNKHGVLSVALSRGDTHTFVIPLINKISGKNIDMLRRLNNQPAADRFATQAIEVSSQGILDGYDHPDAPKAVNISSCVLHTRRFDRMLKRMGYEVDTPMNASGFTSLVARRGAVSAPNV
jgi:hypothetical protein